MSFRTRGSVARAVLALASTIIAFTGIAAAQGRPLSDAEFVSLVQDVSEPDGTFYSRNLVSNEEHISGMVHAITLQAPAGAFIGVGPEQNFTYIAAQRPTIAFIVDIQRGIRDLHIWYKALFELSVDRVEFSSRLFSRALSHDRLQETTVEAMFDALANTPPSEALFEQTLRDVSEVLLTKHKFPPAVADLSAIRSIARAFYAAGPHINWWNTDGNVPVSYADLMLEGAALVGGHSYLATEQDFSVVKALQANNLVVPIVGDFAGPKALREVSEYLRVHETSVGVFYGSNVPDMLGRNNQRPLGEFCQNLAVLPVNQKTMYLGGSIGRIVPGLHTFSDALQRCAAAAAR
jgi:hypothetical protein